MANLGCKKRQLPYPISLSGEGVQAVNAEKQPHSTQTIPIEYAKSITTSLPIIPKRAQLRTAACHSLDIDE